MISYEDAQLLDDPKYRQYANAVEKVLRSFESSSEWADLISALGKLNKTLSSKFNAIPKKITIGKRLAQCMHPALPGGVHLKALEVYSTIFSILESKRLKYDLYIYTMGIFPLFVHASMQVRPKLLKLYETHLLPIEDGLVSCLDGMLLGLLPGLEEGTEHFQRLDTLLEKICESVGELEYYGSLWRCVLSSTSVRLAALQLVYRRFDRKKFTDDQIYIIGSSVDVMVQALGESLRDNSVLTQRAGLDVLVLCCPLSNIPVSKKDVCNLLFSALHCFLRRDMSLNRRLYSWLLGYDLAKRHLSIGSYEYEEQETYFKVFSKELLTKAFSHILIKQTLKLGCAAPDMQIHLNEEMYPCRLLVSLLDKGEIGSVVVEDLLADVFRLLKAAIRFMTQKIVKSKQCTAGEVDFKTMILPDIAKSANILLNAFEPAYLWEFLSQQLKKATEAHYKEKLKDGTENSERFFEICEFVSLLLNISHLEAYEEVQTVHLPNLLYDLIKSITELVDELKIEELHLGLETCKKLLESCQPSHHISSQSETGIQNIAASHQSTKNSLGVDELEKRENSVSYKKSTINRDVLQCSRLFYLFFSHLVLSKLNSTRVEIDKIVEKIEKGNKKRKITEKTSEEIPEKELDSSNNFGNFFLDISGKALMNSFRICCRLLVDFASFPIYCFGQVLTNEFFANSKNEILGLPFWLRTLIWTICTDSLLPSYVHCEIICSSLTTLLDLMALANSSITKSQRDGSSLSGKITVVVVPPLDPSHVSTLLKQTSFYQSVTRKLWQMLDDASMSSLHLSAVHLLIRLHSTCPDGRCEEVLLKEMMHHNKNVRTKALSKFCRLWHYTRHLLSKKSFFQGFRFKNFTRCLFAAIDSLSLVPVSHHLGTPAFEQDNSGQVVELAVASTWLRHCLEERDLVRVLEPLLFIALHPRTHSTLVHSRTDLETEQAGTVTSSDLRVEVKVFPKQMSEDKSLIVDKTKPISYMEFRNRIVEDIAKGKESYRDFVTSLTSLSSSDSDDAMNEVADQFVKNVIKSSLSLLSEESTQKDSNSVAQQNEDDGSALKKDDTVEQMLLAINVNMEIANKNKSRKKKNVGLVDHMLVYQEHVDSNRCLYALRSLRNLLLSQPMLFTYTCVISPITTSSTQTAFSTRLHDLLLRHVRAMLGESFYEEPTTRPQSVMIIDALLLVCLRSMRSWKYPNSSIASGSLHDLRCTSLSLLNSLLGQLSNLLSEPMSLSGMTSSASMSSSSMTARQFSMFVRSLLIKYDLGRTVMACLDSSVMALQTLEDEYDDSNKTSRRSPNKLLVPARDGQLALWWCGENEARVKSFQHHLIGVVQQIFILEHRLIAGERNAKESSDASDSRIPLMPDDGFLMRLQPQIFSALLRILRLQHSCDVHAVWLDLMTFSLPYVTDSMADMSSSVMSQLCRNLEHTTNLFAGNHKKTSLTMNQIPADYVVTLLKSMQALTHTTLFLQNSSHKSTTGSNTQSGKIAVSNNVPSQSPSSAPFFALGSFFSVFSSNNSSAKTHRISDDQTISRDWLRARKATLKNLPKILSCLALVWDEVVAKTSSSSVRFKGWNSFELNPCAALGEKESVSQSILQILNPIALQYGENMICALALVWEKRGRNELRPTDVSFSKEYLSDQQSQLLNLVCHIRSLHCDVMLNLVKNVILQPPEVPPTITSKKRRIQYEERLLHFAFLFIQLQPSPTLKDSWPRVLSLLRECVVLTVLMTLPTTSSSSRTIGITDKGRLTPRCYFLLLLIAAEFVKKIPSFDDKKDQKDLQDVCVKCIEACNGIVDRSLEHGGWLGRRSPAVLSSPMNNLHTEPHAQSRQDVLSEDLFVKSECSESASTPDKDDSSSPPKCSNLRLQTMNNYYLSTVQSLVVLSQVLATLLDVVYGSEEKEKTIPILTSVMTTVVPFVRTRSYKNAPSFRAASSLLASISGYQHTRRSWKREVYEIFLSPDFFRMPFESIADWCSIIDHLMTHDVITFKDFMVRLGTTRSSTTGASLNIFSNKDQELEQRAMLLKRLAFIILSSASNQYQRFLPEIQERLSESIKLLHVPVVQEQVYLCFRVLLLRISPSNLTSLWPSIITELVHTLRDLEYELVEIGIETTLASIKNGKTTANSSSRSGGVSASNANMPQQDKWLALYLAACKLLDLALSLQAKHLHHFKLFRWSFVGESNDVGTEELSYKKNGSKIKEALEQKLNNNLEPFVPHCVRIKKLLAQKNPTGADVMLPVAPLHPLLEMKRVDSIDQLQSFFNTIVSPTTMIKQHQRIDEISSGSSKEFQKSTAATERILWRDFLDEMFYQ